MLFDDRGSDRGGWYVVVFITLCGGLLALTHGGDPLVRNSLVYAHIAHLQHTLGDAFDAIQNSSNKPYGYVGLSYPLIELFGPTTGLRISSFIGTLLFIVASMSLTMRLSVSRRLLGETRIEPPLHTTMMLVICLNPLMMYQFVSAYQDTLFALTFFVGIFALDRACLQDRHAGYWVLFSVTALLSVWIKNQGAFLMVALVIFGYARRRQILTAWRVRPDYRYAMTAAVAITGGVMLLALFSLIPGFNFGAGITDYFRGGLTEHAHPPRWKMFLRNLPPLAFFVLLVTGPLVVPFVMALKSKEFIHLPWKWHATLGLFLAALLCFEGSKYNIRYYLGITPLIAVGVVYGLAKYSKRAQWIWLLLFILWNGPLTIAGNSVTVLEAIKSVAPPSLAAHLIEARGPGTILDNFRIMNQQTYMMRQFDKIGRLLPDYGNRLLFVSNYIALDIMRIYEEEGRYPEGTDVAYVRDRATAQEFLDSRPEERWLIYDQAGHLWKKGERPTENFRALGLNLWEYTPSNQPQLLEPADTP